MLHPGQARIHDVHAGLQVRCPDSFEHYTPKKFEMYRSAPVIVDDPHPWEINNKSRAKPHPLFYMKMIASDAECLSFINPVIDNTSLIVFR
jgi:hypothetical protein